MRMPGFPCGLCTGCCENDGLITVLLDNLLDNDIINFFPSSLWTLITSCDRGTYSAAGLTGECEQCPEGKTDDDEDPATKCTTCPSGV